MLIAMGIVLAAAAAATAALIVTRRVRPQQGELLRVRESPAVIVLGVLLWAFALGLYLYCLLVPGRLYQTASGAGTMALFFGMAAVIGSAALLTGFVRCTVATEKGVLDVGMFGEMTLLGWANIIKLKEANGRLMLLDVRGHQCSVGGRSGELAAFAALAQQRLRPGVGAAVLQNLAAKTKNKK